MFRSLRNAPGRMVAVLLLSFGWTTVAMGQGSTIIDCDIAIRPGTGQTGKTFAIEYTPSGSQVDLYVTSSQNVYVEQGAIPETPLTAGTRYKLHLDNFTGDAADNVQASLENTATSEVIVALQNVDWFGEPSTSGEPLIAFSEDSATSLTMNVYYRKRTVSFFFRINGAGSFETASLAVVRLAAGGGNLDIDYNVQGPKDDNLLLTIKNSVGLYIGQPPLTNKRAYLPAATAAGHKLLIEGYTSAGTITCQLIKEDGFHAIPAGTQPSVTGPYVNTDLEPRIRVAPHRSPDTYLAILSVRYKGRRIVFEIKFT